MRQRGPTFLGAAIVYESSVVTYGSGDSDSNLDLIPIYPFEGTYIATNPACINTAAIAEAQEAAALLRDYLLQPEAQQLALANGLRPVNDQVPPGPPLDTAHGVDLSQPERVFEPPGVETLYAVQEVWQAARKDINLVLLLDISGSMEGDKMENMRRAAIQFVEQMGQDDLLTLIAFSTRPTAYAQQAQVGSARAEIIKIITGLQAGGDTALYDAIGLGSQVIAKSTSSQTSNALIVLTDGMDTSSSEFSFDPRLIEVATANNTTVFAIAYGDDADKELLGNLAQQANGNFYLGNDANIGAIYQEMSAAFGGSVGIGR
jgi:Ca-activated chloride channel family protein